MSNNFGDHPKWWSSFKTTTQKTVPSKNDTPVCLETARGLLRGTCGWLLWRLKQKSIWGGGLRALIHSNCFKASHSGDRDKLSDSQRRPTGKNGEVRPPLSLLLDRRMACTPTRPRSSTELVPSFACQAWGAEDFPKSIAPRRDSRDFFGLWDVSLSICGGQLPFRAQ